MVEICPKCGHGIYANKKYIGKWGYHPDCYDQIQEKLNKKGDSD